MLFRSDWRVQIVRRPDSKAPLRVTTWVRDSVPTGRIFRDYTLADESGTELVCAESRLVLFDLRAQKIIRIDQQRFRSYLPEARGVFASAAPRLRAPAAFDGEKTLPLRRSDIDFNGIGKDTYVYTPSGYNARIFWAYYDTSNQLA